MASDVEDPTIFYADLPSIYENNSSTTIESSYNANTEKSYQPIFGSFLLADSDPLNNVKFVDSSSPSIERETIQEQLMDDCASSNENNISSSIQTTPSSPPPLASIDDIDEDDFDGIPIRHASETIKKRFNGDNDILHHRDDHLFDEYINHIENSHDDYELEDETFLNGFNDEQHETTIIVPSLFKNIPDIDDLNEHEDDNDDDRIPFDHMDMFDQSDSIRSSSPDSLLSSSHLQDEEDDDDVDDDQIDHEVAQWNDDHILHSTPLNINSHSYLNIPINPFDQVDFIDRSRSQSRCSNISSNLSIGYADQAGTFLSDDDELLTSSDSNYDNNIINSNENEDICLQVNLDDHRSISSNSTRSSSPIPDQTPIIDIDEDNNEIQVAPIAALDDEDDNDLQTSISDQPILQSYIPSNIFQLKNLERQNEIVHDIINMRHLFNENNHDDEFLAIMHNPKIFEQILNNEKKSDLVKQTNYVTGTFRPSIQLSNDNKIKNESFEHHQNIHQTSSLLESNNEKTLNSSSYSRKTTTATANNSSPPDVNHLTKEEKENDALMNIINNTNDILNKKQNKGQLHYHTSNINVDNSHMNINSESDDDDDDDLELLKTLSQHHNIINPIESLEKTNEVKPQVTYYSPDINQEKTFSNFSSENRITNGNETELLNKKMQVNSHIILSSPYVIDTIKQSDEEREEKNEKKNVIIYKNHNDGNGDDRQWGKYEARRVEEEEEEEKKLTTFFSLTSSTSPILFNDDSYSPVVIVDPDAASSLPNLLLLSINDSSNRLMTDDSQISNTKSNMNNLPNNESIEQTTSDLFDPFAPMTPTITTTTTTMLDETKPNEDKNQPLANYNFDDLWNQSMSNVDSSNKNVDSDPFQWNEFSNTNTFDDNTTKPKIDFTWESLVNGDEEDGNDLKNFLDHLLNSLHDSEIVPSFVSTQNLESIAKDIQMNSTPFDPIPSPPLHVDHTVTNPMVNATQHDLFPIDEIEQPPQTLQGQQSMTLYEEDEPEENQNNYSFDEDVKPIVEKIVSDILELALTEVNQSYEQVEHFVDQIISQAIYEVYDEDENLTENLASIINWHDQTNKQVLDPFDQKFDSVWSQQFQAPDDTTNENIFENQNQNQNDPWLTTTEPNKDSDPLSLFSKALDDSDLFSSKNTEPEDHETSTISEYLPPPTNPSNTTDNLMKYTLTAPVRDDSGDDSSTLEDYFISHKNESLPITNLDEQTKDMTVTEQKEIEINEPENIFTNQSHLTEFEAFASEKPLHSPKFTHITSQFDDEDEDVDENNVPWTKIEKPTNDEPWELEDNGEEKMTPVPTSARLTSPFNEDEYFPTEKNNSNKNFFSDSFNPTGDTEQTLSKSVRFDDNIQSIRSPTPPLLAKESFESSESDSNKVEIDDITPNFETSFIKIDENDLKTERSYGSAELPSQTIEKLPTLLNDQSNISNDGIPLNSTFSPSNTEMQYKINLRSESEIPTPDTNIRMNTDTQLVQPHESAILRSTSKDDSSIDPDEIDGVIPCVIDNTPVNIDAKAINPFKCVISSAGTLQEDNQTAVIAIYGCALPDHRLREYRYIMDQLFYYVYHKLEKLVTNDYVLIYFHGATSKHRTPDFTFLRKCYQMINFRLRKNLRTVYVVHPTRWLRTVVALSRPFFSNKFFRKIHYLYTIGELERQFPHIHLSIPVTIEQHDGAYRTQ